MTDQTPGPTTAELWHYTCDHGRLGIGDTGWLYAPRDLVRKLPKLPAWQSPMFDWIWFTDMAVPDRPALGLYSSIIGCDRTVHRYRVLDAALVTRWLDVRRAVPQRLRDELENVPGVLPAHWWVSAQPVPVQYAPIIAWGAA